MKGKVTQVDKKNEERDFYQTPYCLTKGLWDMLEGMSWGTVLEPAAGKGAITRVLYQHGVRNITASDKYDDSCGPVKDFLADKFDRVDTVVTNPPFKLFDEFVERAFQVARKRVMMLGPINYVYAQSRTKLFDEFGKDGFRLTDVITFNRKVTCEKTVREDWQFKTGAQCVAWYVWQKDAGHLDAMFHCYDVAKFLINKRRGKNVLNQKTSNTL